MARPRGHSLHALAFGDLLHLRDETQSQVARRSGLSPQMLSSLTRGHTCASLRTAERLAAALDCSPETLFPELGGWSPP